MLTEHKILLPTTSGAASPVSEGFWLKQMFGYSVQAVFTGTLNGTAKLQGSNDEGTTSPNNPAHGLGITTWTDILDSAQPVTGAGPITWNVASSMYLWVRFVYTNSSGTGNVTVTINAKGI